MSDLTVTEKENINKVVAQFPFLFKETGEITKTVKEIDDKLDRFEKDRIRVDGIVEANARAIKALQDAPRNRLKRIQAWVPWAITVLTFLAVITISAVAYVQNKIHSEVISTMAANTPGPTP